MGEPEQQLKMGKGQNGGGFSEEQLQMYKDCFKLMDINKDGQLDKNDLRGAFDNVGVLMSESELDGLLGEISGPCTYDNMVKMFQEKMACSWPSRRSPRLRSPPLLRRPLRPSLRRTPITRRRPPSKCHLQTIEVVKKCSKHSLIFERSRLP